MTRSRALRAATAAALALQLQSVPATRPRSRSRRPRPLPRSRPRLSRRSSSTATRGARSARSAAAGSRRYRRAGPAAGLLLRRDRRRRLEDHQRRRRAGRRSPTASSAGSVGAIAVAPSDPNVVYVGHGRELHPRQRLARRRRLQVDRRRQDLDARRPRATRGRSARIRVHPRDPDLVYVAALGHAFGPEPGARRLPLARTAARPGTKVLFVDDKTGAVRPRDGSVEPARPLRRHSGRCSARPGASRAAARAAACARSTDGGDTWKKLDGKGLPKGLWGRIGVSVSPREPERVYAMIEAEEGGVFRSDDGGATWQRMNDERNLRQRAWYYTPHLRRPAGRRHGLRAQRPVLPLERRRQDLPADPRPARRQPRPVDRPERPAAHDRGQRRRRHVSLRRRPDAGRRIDNQPTAQFYHVIADDQLPVPRLRRAAGQLDGRDREPQRAARASAARDWYAVGGRRERLHRARAGRPRRRLRRLLRRLHRAATTSRTGQERDDHRLARQPDGLGRRGHEVPLPVDLPDRVLAPRPGRALRRRQRAVPLARTRARAGRRSAPT